MKNFLSYFKVAIFLIGLSLTSCELDDETVPAGQFENGVFIINEGNFSEADGSLSFYDKNLDEVNLKIFENVNGRKLSGTFQSLTFYDGRGYLIDNSGSIEVFEEDSLHSVTTVTSSLVIPRHMAAVGNKAYISDWGPYDASYDNPESFVAVLDLTSFDIIKTIPVASEPEEMLAYKGKIFIANQASNVITVIDPSDDGIEEIEVPTAPQAMEIDASGKIWVLCGSGSLVKLNPDNGEIEDEVTFEGDSPAGELEINSAGNKLYFLTSRYEPDYSTVNYVYAFNIGETSINSSPIISKKNLYGLGVDPETDIIYVSDNNALQGNGTVIRFRPDGTEIDNFAVGRNPGGFVFK